MSIAADIRIRNEFDNQGFGGDWCEKLHIKMCDANNILDYFLMSQKPINANIKFTIYVCMPVYVDMHLITVIDSYSKLIVLAHVVWLVMVLCRHCVCGDVTHPRPAATLVSFLTRLCHPYNIESL